MYESVRGSHVVEGEGAERSQNGFRPGDGDRVIEARCGCVRRVATVSGL